MDWNRYNIVGTSQEVFKDYLRLTTVCLKLYPEQSAKQPL